MKPTYWIIAGTVALSLLGGVTLATGKRADIPQPPAGNPTIKATVSDSKPADTSLSPSRLPAATTLRQPDGVVQKKSVDNAPRYRLKLTDEVPPDSDFARFRSRLLQAVQSRDANFIRQIAAPDIKLSFGGSLKLDDVGIDNPKATIWVGLEKAMGTGCAKSSQLTDTWICPQVFETWPSNLDAFTYVAIIGENVNVRASANTNSRVLGLLSNEAVKIDQKTQQREKRFDLNNLQGWTPIIMPNGDRGYVANRYVYSQIGYRAFFKKFSGKWKMTVLVTGD